MNWSKFDKMKKKASRYWICQISGWLSYGLTLIFFSYILEKQLSPVFYPRMVITILVGFGLSHLLRTFMVKAGLRPPMATHQWWKVLVMFFAYTLLYSFLISSIFEIFKLYDAGRKMTHYVLPDLSLQNIIAEWNPARVTKRFLISLVFDTPISVIWISVYMLWHFIEFSNSEAIKHSAAEGLGIACLSRAVVTDLIQLGKLVELETSLPPLTRNLYIIQNKHKVVSRWNQGFLEHCRHIATLQNSGLSR